MRFGAQWSRFGNGFREPPRPLGSQTWSGGAACFGVCGFRFSRHGHLEAPKASKEKLDWGTEGF